MMYDFFRVLFLKLDNQHDRNFIEKSYWYILRNHEDEKSMIQMFQLPWEIHTYYFSVLRQFKRVNPFQYSNLISTIINKTLTNWRYRLFIPNYVFGFVFHLLQSLYYYRIPRIFFTVHISCFIIFNNKSLK